MDAFVFPSRTDTFGLVLLEAMASGVPVVVSPETGTRVGIRHGVTGFHAPDEQSLTESVRQLMSSETLRQQIGTAARAFTCDKAWNGVFEQLYRTYEWGLAAARQRKQTIGQSRKSDDLIAHDAHSRVSDIRD